MSTPVTLTLTTNLDIIDKYKQLVKASLDGDSIYIKTKETLQDMFDNDSITEQNKSEILSSVLGSINKTVITSAMSSALAWESGERELIMKKAELEKKLEALDVEIASAEETSKKTISERKSIEAASLRAHGSATTDASDKVVALSNSGTEYSSEQGVIAKTANIEAETDLIASKEKELFASINKIVADTYTNFGVFNGYSLSETGLVGTNIDNTPTSHTTLSKTQQVIAAEQAKGYAWNAWSNVASGLGATIGTALSTESDIFSGASTEPGPAALAAWQQVIGQLKDVQPPS